MIGRTDLGSLVVKFIRLSDVRAEAVLEQITARDESSSFTLTADPNSNQLVVWGDIGYCQQIEELASRLDKIYVKPRTQTFRLRYADASDVSDNILDLFEDSGSGSGASGSSNFKGNLPEMVEQGFRVIAPDLIGYGYSDKPDDVDYHLDLFVECV